MSNVISLKKPSPNDIQIEGPAVCMGCRHKWTHIDNKGTVSFECPSCKAQKGAWNGAVVPNDDDEIFICKCENDLFFIMRDRIWCANCGICHSFDDAMGD